MDGLQVGHAAQNHLACCLNQQIGKPACSVREVEVIVGVLIVLTLSEDGADKVEGSWDPSDAEPDTESVVEDDTLDEESLESTEEEVVEPLLGGVGSVVEDETTGVG